LLYFALSLEPKLLLTAIGPAVLLPKASSIRARVLLHQKVIRAQVWRVNHSQAASEELCYNPLMPRRRRSRRPILERFMPIRASDFCNENLGDYFCDLL
jgi:hypothetical protein